MSDLTKCTGEGCLVRHRCYRYTAEENRAWQSWFCEVPAVHYSDARRMDCRMFWDTQEQDSVAEIIKAITLKPKRKSKDITLRTNEENLTVG